MGQIRNLSHSRLDHCLLCSTWPHPAPADLPVFLERRRRGVTPPLSGAAQQPPLDCAPQSHAPYPCRRCLRTDATSTVLLRRNASPWPHAAAVRKTRRHGGSLPGSGSDLPNKQATIITSPNKLSNRSLKRSLSPAGAPRDTRLRCARALLFHSPFQIERITFGEICFLTSAAEIRQVIYRSWEGSDVRAHSPSRCSSAFSFRCTDAVLLFELVYPFCMLLLEPPYALLKGPF